MTYKEALDVLRRGIKCNGEDCPPVSCGECGYNVTDKEWNEAFTKALEVLEEQEDGAFGSMACTNVQKSHDGTTDDLISRDQTLKTIAEMMPSLSTPDGTGPYDHEIQVGQETYVDIIEAINKMPAVRMCDTCRFTYYEKAKEEGDE